MMGNTRDDMGPTCTWFLGALAVGLQASLGRRVRVVMILMMVEEGVGQGWRGTMGEATLSSEMSLVDELRSKRTEVLRVAARHGAGNVAVFGSVARGEETTESDVDLLIDVVGPTSAWFPGGLVAELEEMLGRRVQVVTRRSLSPWIREVVLREAVGL